MKEHYIKAILPLLASDMSVDVVLKNLRKLLIAKGHLSIHREILTGMLGALMQKSQTDAPTITVAKEEDAKKLKSNITAALSKLGAKEDKTEAVIDETLIGGFKVAYKGNTIDASYKNTLLTLYRNITK